MFDYISIAQSRLTSIFAEKPLVTALTGAMVSQLYDLELVADQLKQYRWIETAEGKQLDGCGEIVGERRIGRDDEAYRDAIYFRIFVNTSNGTPEDLIKALKWLTKADNVQYIEQYPATSIMFTDGPNIHSNIHDAMQDMAPAGVSDIQVLVSYTRKDPFRFGKLSKPSDMMVNDGYLQVNSSYLQVSNTEVTLGSRLSGVAASPIDAGGGYIQLSGGAFLAINDPNLNSTFIDSGYHLTGVYA